MPRPKKTPRKRRLGQDGWGKTEPEKKGQFFEGILKEGRELNGQTIVD